MNKKWVILGTLLAVPIVYAQRFSFPNLYGFGGYGGGLFDLGGIYSQYPGFIDFLAFFMIFSGISRLVFSRLFPSDKVGVKTLYVGLGFALAFGGTYYNYLSLAHFGNFAFAFAMIIGGISVYGIFIMLGMNRWLAMLIAVAVLLFAAPIFAGVNENAFGTNFLPAISSSWIYTIAGVAIIIGLIWGLFHMMRNRTRGGGSGSSQGLPTVSSGTGWFRRRWRKMNKPASIGETKRGINKRIFKQFDKAYVSFEEGQFNMMVNLGHAIGDWLNEYIAENKGGKGYDEFTGQRDSDARRKQVVNILKQLRSNARYQARRLRWTRKHADRFNDKNINAMLNTLEKDESDFRLYLSKMFNVAVKPAFADPQDIASYYNSLRTIAIEMRGLYSQLKGKIKG